MIEAERMTEFKAGVERLEDTQIAFIETELGIAKDVMFGFTDDELNEKVYEPMCDIEIEEAPIDDSPESERCSMASDIVTILGNSLAEYNGWIGKEKGNRE